MDIKPLTGTDIRSTFIVPANNAAGWYMMRQVRE